MASFRVYFRDRRGDIAGREDIDAEDDGAALCIADLLGEACSDVCASVELWQGMRRVEAPRDAVPSHPASLERITARMQECVLQREEAIRDSAWTIASSKRLLERTARLADMLRRDRENAPPPL